jgi:hypothetical protein
VWRHRGAFTIVLLLLIALLLFGLARIKGPLYLERLSRYAQAINAIAALVFTVVLIAGAVLCYYRFFSGRTLSRVAHLGLAVTVHPLTEEENLHAIDFSMSNVGTTAIWNPKPRCEIRFLSGDGHHREIVDQWWRPGETSAEQETESVIEPLDSATDHMIKRVPVHYAAVSYFFTVEARGGSRWSKSITISNRVGESVLR